MLYLLEIIIILILIVLNGIFAMAEFAIVSVKKARLQQRAEEGDTRAAAALEIVNEPTQFLSTVQIGITLVGIFAGAFGGATIARELAAYLKEFPEIAPYSDPISLTIVVLVITYLTLIFGELVPKRLALNNSENIASVVAKPMQLLSFITAPLVIILSHSTEAMLRVLQFRKITEPPVTEEEIKIMLAESTEAGIFEKAELRMVEGVFDLGDRRVESLMTHRSDIVALDQNDPADENLRKMIQSGRSNFPVYEGNLDNIIGMVSVKNVLGRMMDDGTPNIKAAVIKPLFISQTLPVLKLLESFKATGVHIALVTDEYGGIQGIITLHDILEAIVGDVRTLGEPVDTPVVVREDGSWLINGDIPVEDIKKILSVDSFPGEDKSHYRTIAGLILFILERIPKTGDHIEVGGLRYEVVDMDGNRIDKVLVTRIPAERAD
ncbi:MAG: hemolysin family protein [Methanoregula sp.]|jgi:putative hemolysin|nr:hemolysin family protein [Methanoregula sp.]